jgi:flagellar basal-body rod modification protein FlgD
MANAIQDVIPATRSSASPLAVTSAASIQDRFLTLLVTQLKNQDPLSPMDNSQITTQLSQISTVSGIDKLNGTMSGLASALSASLAASQSMSNISMIGRDIMAPGVRLNLADGKATGAIQLAEAADKVTIQVVGAAGNVVGRFDIDRPSAGLNAFTWDGRGPDGRAAASGSYAFQVEATRQGRPIEATAYMTGKVTGVGVTGTDSTLIVDGIGEVRFADVKRIQ